MGELRNNFVAGGGTVTARCLRRLLRGQPISQSGQSHKGDVDDGFAVLRRPYGAESLLRIPFPTLKRGANHRCASGAMEIGTGLVNGAIGIGTGLVNGAIEIGTGLVNNLDLRACPDFSARFFLSCGNMITNSNILNISWTRSQILIKWGLPLSGRMFRRSMSVAALLLFSVLGRAEQTLQPLAHHVRPAVSTGRATLLGPLPQERRLAVSIILPLRNQAALSSLLTRLYDPSSPDYRHFLTVDEFTVQFGPTPDDYQAVVDFAQAQGLTLTAKAANRLIVPVSGSVEQIEKAFHVRMNLYQHPTESRTFFSPDREPSLDLRVPVAHITGLNNYSLPRSLAVKAAAGQQQPAVTGSGPGGSYLASDMRAAYYGSSLPSGDTPLTGLQQTVGILEFDGYSIAEVASSFAGAADWAPAGSNFLLFYTPVTGGTTYNIPVNNVLLDGATGASDSGEDAEQVLDIVQAIGMAPGVSQVRVYVGNTENGTDDASILNAMAAENVAKQLSCSWAWDPDDPATDDVFFEEFAAQGQTFFAASGDSGAFDESDNPYFYPQEDAYLTAVGATHLTTNGAGGGWVSEATWNSSDYGSGGGISPDGIPIPGWQSSVANSANEGSSTLRNVPDVAMEGDFDNYNCETSSGCSGGWAGTSFAAPRWAGFMALVNQQAEQNGTAPTGLGFIDPAIYALGAGSSYDLGFHDVTSGTNDTDGQPIWFSAVIGYDLVTGWGSPTGQGLVDALAGPQAPGFWMQSAKPQMYVNPGSSNSTTITITDAGGFSGSVHLAITSALPTGVTAAWSTNPTTSSSVLTLTATSSAPVAATTLTITGTAGSLTETTQIALAVHAPAFTLSAAPATVLVGQSASASSTVAVTPEYGFGGSVQLAVTSALPAGVTAAWGTNPTTGVSLLTFTTTSAAAASTSTVAITGTSGSLTATTTVTLTVEAAKFVLTTAATLNIGRGAGGTVYVYVGQEFGFSGSVNLSVSGLPAGVTAAWSPNPTAAYSLLTLTAASTAALGSTSLTITGTSGTLTASTTLTLGIFAPAFTLSSVGSMTVGQGSSVSQWFTVSPEYGFNGSVNFSISSALPSGVTASWSPNPTTGFTTLTLTASSTAALGTTPVTIVGASGSLTASTTGQVSVYAPSFTLAAYGPITLGQGTSNSTSVGLNALYGFAGSVNLSVSGLPSGVTAAWSPNPTVGASSLTLTATSAVPVGSTTLTITGTCGALKASTPLTLSVYAPTFTLSSYGGTTLGQGGSSSIGFNVNPEYGFSGSVKMAVSGLPGGVTASWSPNPTTGYAELNLTASNTATVGAATLTVTGTSGTQSATTTATLTVAAPSFTLSSYGATLFQGNSTSTYINVSSENGFNGYVDLAVSGVPPGVTATLGPNPIAGASSSMLMLAASNTAAPGNASVTVTGVSGGVTASTTVPISIVAPAFTISGWYGQILAQGTSTTTYVYIYSQNGFSGNVSLSISGLPSGVTATWSANPTNFSSTLTLVASSSAPIGTSQITVTGKSGSLSASATGSLQIVAPSLSLQPELASLSMGPNSTVTDELFFSLPNNGVGNVSLAVSGLPSGVTASWSQNPASQSSVLTLTSSSAALGSYNLTVTGKFGTVTATTTITLGIFAPAFTLSPAYATIGQGSTTSASISISGQYGFNGGVILSASGLPAGVSAAWAQNPATLVGTIELVATSNAALGQYNVTITGSSGNMTASTTLNLTVSPQSFGLYIGSWSGVSLGGSGTANFYVEPAAGFTGLVSFSVSGLPSGVTAAFSPTASATGSTLTFTASGTASTGQYNVTITGTSGTLTATAQFQLTVYAPTFTLNSGSVSLFQGSTGSTYAYAYGSNYGLVSGVTLSIAGLPSGVTASISPNPTTTGESLINLTATGTAALGEYNATLTGTAGSAIVSTPLNITIAPQAFTMSATPSGLLVNEGSSVTSTINVGGQPPLTGNVTLSASGLPSGLTASFSPNPTVNSSSVMTLTASAGAAPQYINFNVVGTSGTLNAETQVGVTIFPPGFTLANAPGEVNLVQGGTGKSTITVLPVFGFSSPVHLTIGGLPSGVTAAWSLNSTTGNSVLTLTASGSAAVGTSTATITGISGTLISATSVAITVKPAPAATATALTLTSGGAAVTAVQAGSVVTLTASVTDAGGAVTIGQVRFCDASAAYCLDMHLLGTAQLTSAGVAVLRLVPGIGSHSYKAVFAGTGSAASSSSSAAALTVAGAFTDSTGISVSGYPGSYTLVGQVGTQGSATPTGQVSFVDTTSGGEVLATAALAPGPSPGWINTQSPSTGQNPASPVTADFNGDGIPDLATVNENSETLTILLGKGDGTFTPVSVNPATGNSPVSMVTADFNGDGKPDLAVVNQSDNTVTTLLGNGDGTFTPSAASPSAGGNPTMVVTADFNGDGIPDLALVNQSNNGSLTILLGNGDGTFTPANSLPVIDPYWVAVGDFNGDGIPDLAVTNYEYTGTVQIFLGQGDGSFTPMAVNPPAAIEAQFLIVGDFNGDGKQDLAVAGTYLNTLTVLLGNGDGSFSTAPGNPPSVYYPSAIAVGDFNGDGHADMALASLYGDSVTLLLGDGTGEFTTATGPPTGAYPQSIVTADFNGDGAPDLAVANNQGGNVSILASFAQVASATVSAISPFGTGTHQVEMSYPGDSNNAPGFSAPVALTAELGTPTVTVTPSQTSDPIAEPLQVKVKVTGSDLLPAPTGTVTVALSYYGNYIAPAVKLSGGSATITIPAGAFPLGSDYITAAYSGDANFVGAQGFSWVDVTASPQAVLTSPMPGSSLASNSATFGWSYASGGSICQLLLGTTGPGSSNLYTSSQTTLGQLTVNNLPTNGETIYARIETKVGSTWLYSDTTYKAESPASLTSPAPGSVLPGASVAFSWSAPFNATGYFLWIGSTGVGSNDIYNSEEKTVTSYTFPRIPTNGETIYVRLITNFSGTWVPNDYTFKAAVVGASLTSPAAGSTLTGSSVTFNWPVTSGATGYFLWIGTTGVGSSDLYYSAEKTVESYTFSHLPLNGGKIYVRLITNFSGDWVSNDSTFNATMPAAIESPAPGAQLAASASFTWSAASGATGYYLWIGSTGVGSNNIYNSAEKTGTTYTFSPLPANGEKIYVRLITNFNGTWVSNDYSYTAATQSMMSSPAPGGVFTGSSVPFTWTAATGATGYYLLIGSTGAGSNNIYNSAEKTVTAYTFTSMPTNGEPIYVRLVTNFNGVWVDADYTYTAATGSP
jgi:hypothetical protein